MATVLVVFGALYVVVEAICRCDRSWLRRSEHYPTRLFRLREVELKLAQLLAHSRRFVPRQLDGAIYASSMV